MWCEGVPNDKKKDTVTQTENQLICTKHGCTLDVFLTVHHSIDLIQLPT
jgi:hypothetical protein